MKVSKFIWNPLTRKIRHIQDVQVLYYTCCQSRTLCESLLWCKCSNCSTSLQHHACNDLLLTETSQHIRIILAACRRHSVLQSVDGVLNVTTSTVFISRRTVLVSVSVSVSWLKNRFSDPRKNRLLQLFIVAPSFVIIKKNTRSAGEPQVSWRTSCFQGIWQSYIQIVTLSCLQLRHWLMIEQCARVFLSQHKRAMGWQDKWVQLNWLRVPQLPFGHQAFFMSNLGRGHQLPTCNI